ncbi:MAG: hypothetical protein JW871_02940 [Endomicrobiales bacterium]|nr:hypothetical protein [Endomicrobiales bacterium]
MMRLFYALIISLNIIAFSSFLAYSADKDKDKDKKKKEAAEEVEKKENKSSDKKEDEINQRIYDQLNTLYTQIELLDNKYNDLSVTVNTSTTAAQINEVKDNQESFYRMLQSLDENQQELSKKLDDLSKASVAKSSPSVDQQQMNDVMETQAEIMSLLSELAENQKELESKLSRKTSEPKTSLTPSDQGLVPSEISFEDIAGQQYIRLKLIENGQEVELFLDPTYVDMNLDLSKVGQKSKEETQKTPASTDNYNMDKMMDYLSESLASRATITPSQTAPQVSPSYTYNISGPPQQSMPQSKEEYQKPDEERYRPSREQAIEDPKALDYLHKAQKLYYAKRYNAALNAAQRSLSKQETALGYALEGSIYFTMGDVDLAINSWENALKLNPDMPEVKKVLFKYKR